MKHRQLSSAKRGELVELVELLKDFKSNFKNGFLSSDDQSDDTEMKDPNKDTVISESDAVQKIAQLQIRSNHLEHLNRRTERQIESRLQVKNKARFGLTVFRNKVDIRLEISVKKNRVHPYVVRPLPVCAGAIRARRPRAVDRQLVVIAESG